MNELVLTTNQEIDPEGLQADVDFLSEQQWRVSINIRDSATWEKASGVLSLTLRQSLDNKHRVIWEISVNALRMEAMAMVRVGYAAETARPGDLSEKRLNELIKKAVKSGEDQLATTAFALAEAKKLLGLTPGI